MKNKLYNLLEIFRNELIQAEVNVNNNEITLKDFNLISDINKTVTSTITQLISLLDEKNVSDCINYIKESILPDINKTQILNILNNVEKPIHEPITLAVETNHITNTSDYNTKLIQEIIAKLNAIDATKISDTVYTRLKQYVDDSNPPAPTDTTSEIDVANFLREFKETNLNALTALETKLSTIVNNVELNVSNTTKQVANIQLKISQQENNKQSIDDETKLVTSQMVEFTKKADLNKLTDNLNIMARYTQNFNLQAGRMCGKIAQLMNVDIKKRAYFIIGSFFFICIASTTVSHTQS